MREEPPQELIGLLERLGLATATQVRGMGRRARRLARGLPLFQSVWVDALAQARVLTPFQAAEINAGRGNALLVGSYVLCRRLPSPGYVDCYVAREIESREMVRLAIAEPPAERRPEVVRRLEELAAKSESLAAPALAPVTRAGADGGRVWAAGRHVPGRTAAEWMVHNGRFPPGAVLEIARQMLAGLEALERAELCHGDVSAGGLMLSDAGDVVLAQPGLRGVIRPEEGYGHAELMPEAYDYLAPERIAGGTPPTTAGDVYACGSVWWHLLTGRTPISGGNSLAKLRAAQTARIPDVRRLAPDTPDCLAAAISACVEQEVGLRPESMAKLRAVLGPPSRAGRRILARCVGRPERWLTFRAASARASRKPKQPPSWAAVAGCLVAVAALLCWLWDRGLLLPAASRPVTTEETATEQAYASVAAPTAHATTGSGGRSAQSSPEAEGSPEAEDGGTGLASTGYADGSADETAPHPGAVTRDRPHNGSTPGPAVDDLVLSAHGPVAGESLSFRAGGRVRGEGDGRPRILVPATGLVVRPERVCFEDVDFVWGDSTGASPSSAAEAAVIHVLAARAEFRGCSFQGGGTATPLPIAVRWTHPAEPERGGLSLPSGQLKLSDCVFRRVGAGISCETLGARAVELANVLYLGTGPLVRLDHCPKSDEPTLVRLSDVTLRNAGPLLECRYRQIFDQPGEVSIQASGCVLATRPEAALLSFVGPVPPERLAADMRWAGEGSVVPPEGIVAAWQAPDGRVQVLDDALFSIAGLVRSEVGFAGPAETGPEANRIVRWQVPLRRSAFPGVDPGSLAWPEQ